MTAAATGLSATLSAVVAGLRKAWSDYWDAVAPVLRKVEASPRYRAVRAAERVGLGRECRDALNRLDTALDDAEATYTELLEAERQDWADVGQHALRWQLWAALTPVVTWGDVLASMHLVLHNREACDWTQEQAARVCLGLMEGWMAR